jgi:hypothetical protein
MLQLLSWDVFHIFADDSIGDLPDLKQIILSRRAKNPGVIKIPAEVRNPVGVATMHKQPVGMGYQQLQAQEYS